jgi:hypothetical protein
MAGPKKALKPFERLINHGKFNVDFKMDKPKKELKIPLSPNPNSDKLAQTVVAATAAKI